MAVRRRHAEQAFMNLSEEERREIAAIATNEGYFSAVAMLTEHMCYLNEAEILEYEREHGIEDEESDTNSAAS